MTRALRLLLTLVLGALWVLPLGVGPAAAGGGRCHEGFTDRSADTIKTIGGCFLPTVARVAVGTTVTWQAGDSLPHTVTGATGAFGAAQPVDELTASRPVSVSFERAGVYPYVCVLHPGMAGAVVVGDAPEAAAAPGAADGVAGDGEAVQAAAAASSGQEAGGSAAAAGLGIAGVLVLLVVTAPRLVRRRRAASAVTPRAI